MKLMRFFLPGPWQGQGQNCYELSLKVFEYSLGLLPVSGIVIGHLAP